MVTPLVTALWLRQHIDDADLRVVDTRFSLGNPALGRSSFEAGHLPGAVFVDLERDLCGSARVDRVGGRHPLLEIEKLEATFCRLGISNSHHVLAYDDPSDGTGFWSSHLWWLLRYLGHDRVSVLDGGLPAWVAAGGSLETTTSTYPSATFHAEVRNWMVVDAAHVQSRSKQSILIDSRSPERYRGVTEPIDWKAGHIPGAINRNWADNMQDGYWKSSDAQASRFERIKDAEEIIVYCGSGVSATANLLALALANVGRATLYRGSWSDWISNDSRPIEK